jgi:hypothetical protein
MEREMGLEPTTSSLGKRYKIVSLIACSLLRPTKNHGVSRVSSPTRPNGVAAESEEFNYAALSAAAPVL